MKLLFDQNISFRVPKRLSSIFSVCKHVSDCGLMDSEDSDIWMYAKKYDYTIVTFDADFYDISLVNGHPPKIIWLRTGNLSRQSIIELLTDKQKQLEEFINANEFKGISCLEIE